MALDTTTDSWCSLTDSSLMHSLTQSVIHSLTHSLTHPLTHLFAYLSIGGAILLAPQLKRGELHLAAVGTVERSWPSVRMSALGGGHVRGRRTANSWKTA